MHHAAGRRRGGSLLSEVRVPPTAAPRQFPLGSSVTLPAAHEPHAEHHLRR